MVLLELVRTLIVSITHQVTVDDRVCACAHHAGDVTHGVDDAQLLVGQPASGRLALGSSLFRQVQRLKNEIELLTAFRYFTSPPLWMEMQHLTGYLKC